MRFTPGSPPAGADSSPQSRMVRSLRALTVGDAFGNTIARRGIVVDYPETALPDGPWAWTDDSEMAHSIADELVEHHHIEQDSLARRFSRRHDLLRDYGPGTTLLLAEIGRGVPWRSAAGESFGGKGSWGNGAAMRVAPLGAWFADDLEVAAQQAVLAAEITHSHPDAIAGAVAVATAAGLATTGGSGVVSETFIRRVADHTPDGPVREGILATVDLTDADVVAAEVGNGSEIKATDTVPFVIWCAANHLGDMPDAFWTGVSVGGDRDTICAMVGGIVGNSATLPEDWHARCEPPPSWSKL